MVHHLTMPKSYQCEYDRVHTLTVHHINKTKTHQCKYDRVRTLTVHHTNKIRTYQYKYDRVRTQRYTIQTTRQITNIENINGTPSNQAKALSM